MTRNDCPAYFSTSQARCQDVERSPNLAITNCPSLPDEVHLEIFDFYRQGTDHYDYLWREKYAWLNLAHVCRRWRAVVFASSSRLNLNLIVGPVKPRHIKTILSSHLPILIDYMPRCGLGNATDRSAVWRMRAALRHRDRVREISIQRDGDSDIFRNFIEAADYHFPALESLVLCFPGDKEPSEIPATFLRGPDQPDLHLRRLKYDGSIASFVSGPLASAKALTDLTLNVTTPTHAGFEPSQVSSEFLLACLQDMFCLRNLELTISYPSRDFLAQDSQDSPVPEDAPTCSMSELTHFWFFGPTTFLNHFVSRLSAPSLRDVSLVFFTKFPLQHLSRIIDEVREDFRSVSVTFNMGTFHLLSSTHLGEIGHSNPSESSFRFKANYPPYSINSTKLAMAEELTLNFPSSMTRRWEVFSPFCEFIRQFRSVRMLRVNPFVPPLGRDLKQDEAIFPVLEEVKISVPGLRGCSQEEYQCRAAIVLAAFGPCERVGRLVNVSCCE